MPLMDKIMSLCTYNKVPISKLENDLGYSNGSIKKSGANAMKSERVRDIAKYFNVTPTYLMTDMIYCICPTCGIAYDPINEATINSHKILHKNFLKLRDEVGYLMNISEADTKRAIAESFLKKNNLPDDGKAFHYETLLRCDYAEYAYDNSFIVDVSYFDFLRNKIKERKYFELIPDTVIKNMMVKYNVDPNDTNVPLTDLFQRDKEFMANMTDLWDLPPELRLDVYKAIRHAKRDYADKEYYTNPYASSNADFKKTV